MSQSVWCQITTHKNGGKGGEADSIVREKRGERGGGSYHGTWSEVSITNEDVQSHHVLEASKLEAFITSPEIT